MTDMGNKVISKVETEKIEVLECKVSDYEKKIESLKSLVKKHEVNDHKLREIITDTRIKIKPLIG